MPNTPSEKRAAFANTKFCKPRSITSLADYPNPRSPTDSVEEALFYYNENCFPAWPGEPNDAFARTQDETPLNSDVMMFVTPDRRFAANAMTEVSVRVRS